MENIVNEINDCTAPCLIEHFTGQERVKRQVKTALEAAWMDGNRLPHMIFAGPPGVGKSQMASIIINGGVKVSHLAGQKCTAWPLYSRDHPGCQFQS